jgi:molecular chaperone DnaK
MYSLLLRNVCGCPDEPLNLQLWIDPRGSGRKIKDTLPDMVKLPGSWSESHQWRIGMRVNRSQIAYLVVEEMNNKHLRAEYELGNVLAKMFSGFVLIE